MLTRLRSFFSAVFNRGSTSHEERQLGYTEQVMAARVPGLPNTMARIAVNEHTALRCIAVYACIRVLSETKGSLPMEVIETSKSGKESITRQHPVAQLLTYEPYEEMTSPVWSEVRQADMLTGGNGYCEIVWSGEGVVLQLIPRHWSLVRPFRDKDGSLKYELHQNLGGTGGVRILDRSQMLHVPFFGNGIVGWSPIRMLAETIGIHMAQDKFAAAYFGNSAKPSIVIQTQGTMSDEAYNRLKHELEINYSGDNAHRPFVIEQGEAKPLLIPADEAQLLESREFQEEDICRAYRMPPHMIGLLRRATFSNIEAQDLSFEKHTMRPLLIRDEAELNRKLFLKSERGRFHVRHNVEDLLRADIKTRYDAYKTAILSGFKSRNEVRATEHLAPVPGCDELLLPQAIFGKPGNGGGAPDPDKQVEGDGLASARAPHDSRLTKLARQTVEGLLAREVTHAERWATKPESFAEQVRINYQKHESLIREKLGCLGDVEPAIRMARGHQSELLAMCGTPNLPEAVASLTATWSADAEKVAVELLSQ